MTAVLVAAATGAVSHAAAQTPDDVTRLKAEVANLRKQVSNLEKEIELLRREIALMKGEAKAKPDGARGPTTEARSRTKVTVSGGGPSRRVAEYELVKCVRNSTKPTRVTFTFAVQIPEECVHREFPIGVCRKLNIITGGGKGLEGRVVDGPGVHVGTVGTELHEVVYITQGDWKKFQVTYEGVDEDITELDQVELTMGAPIGLAQHTVTFHGIKIESK
jgi:hypothetical protein